MKDFRKELDLNLTKEQLVRMKEMDDRRQQMVRQNRSNHDNDTMNMRNERRHNPDGRLSPEGQPPQFPEHDSTRLPNNK
jgi:hypothetical protein